MSTAPDTRPVPLEIPAELCRRAGEGIDDWRISAALEEFGEDTLRLLAEEFADHPDYRESEWAP